jgi:hypothetical protein
MTGRSKDPAEVGELHQVVPEKNFHVRRKRKRRKSIFACRQREKEERR